MYISRYLAEAGTEACLMLSEINELVAQDKSHPANFFRTPIFIDENLIDLAEIKKHVIESGSLVILLTPGFFSRPWCLVELVTAIRNDVNIVPVELQRAGCPTCHPDDEDILAGTLVGRQGIEILAREGICAQDIVAAVKQIRLESSLPYIPMRPRNIREKQLLDILKRCSGIRVLTISCCSSLGDKTFDVVCTSIGGMEVASININPLETVASLKSALTAQTAFKGWWHLVSSDGRILKEEDTMESILPD